ncbi:hypothetical protein [Cesiribacter sp. SM1]|uniref:hypothetical protein n=1 Tax=Cesiribacter sp. SM1 TaxID=2861196 RepID=UPI001CD782CF|nr:hypothetical protein [Cesiribacter sp. SM1]
MTILFCQISFLLLAAAVVASFVSCTGAFAGRLYRQQAIQQQAKVYGRTLFINPLVNAAEAVYRTGGCQVAAGNSNISRNTGPIVLLAPINSTAYSFYSSGLSGAA